jgi:hypothetical protein
VLLLIVSHLNVILLDMAFKAHCAKYKLIKVDLHKGAILFHRIYTDLTNNFATIHDCTVYFNFKLPSVLLASRCSNFLIKYKSCYNYLCNLIAKLTVYIAKLFSCYHVWRIKIYNHLSAR